MSQRHEHANQAADHYHFPVVYGSLHRRVLRAGSRCFGCWRRQRNHHIRAQSEETSGLKAGELQFLTGCLGNMGKQGAELWIDWRIVLDRGRRQLRNEKPAWRSMAFPGGVAGNVADQLSGIDMSTIA